MKDWHTSERIRVLVLLMIVIGVALGSFWVMQVVRKGLNESMPSVQHNEPDYYVNQFKFVRMTSNGLVHYAVSGERMTHNPVTATFEIEHPIVTSLTEGEPPITARAERAVSDQDNSKVHLYDNVVVNRPASGTTEHFQFKTDYLLVLPDDDVMQTDKPVEIALGSSNLTGTGMYVNNATREFKLMHHTHGIYYPPHAQ